MRKPKTIQNLVDEFASSVLRQTAAIGQGDHRTGNRHAQRYVAAFEKLRMIGDAGRDAMVQLLRHPSSDVRTAAAAFLLQYRTEEALEVLRTEAAGKGLVAFEASEAVKRWEEGEWDLDRA